MTGIASVPMSLEIWGKRKYVRDERLDWAFPKRVEKARREREKRKELEEAKEVHEREEDEDEERERKGGSGTNGGGGKPYKVRLALVEGC